MKLAVDSKMLKRRIMRIFFVVEVFFFLGMYFFGSDGIQCLMQLQFEQRGLDLQLYEIKNEITALNEQIEKWEATPFFKEKVAREQLQMARDGDEIYYIG